MRIVVDAMGSDAHPEPDVAGAVMAAREYQETIILVGDETRIKIELAKYDLTNLSIEIVHASEAVSMTDKPSSVVKTKPNSSMHVGMNLVKNGKADAFVTAGNTGGALAIAILSTLRRIRGIKRPALCAVFPTPGNPIMLDAGANADCKPDYLVQFAKMGAIYAQHIHGIANPRVGILSNGEEEGKGNSLIKETALLLAQTDLNFIGNIEPKEMLLNNAADLVITDGFTGNLVMKTAEAMAKFVGNSLKKELSSSPVSMLGGLLAKPALSRLKKLADPSEIGGAPLLGVNGVVIIGHGRSDAHAIKQAVYQARKMVLANIVPMIQAGLSNSEE